MKKVILRETLEALGQALLRLVEQEGKKLAPQIRERAIDRAKLALDYAKKDGWDFAPKGPPQQASEDAADAIAGVAAAAREALADTNAERISYGEVTPQVQREVAKKKPRGRNGAGV